jgi:multiple antibiotic resistance protein
MKARMSLLSAVLTAFIPIFVAMDAVGCLPFYMGMVGGMSERDRRKILLQAVLTAAAVGVGFIFLGKGVFFFLGVTVSDFKVAGGLVLLVLAAADLLSAEPQYRKMSGAVGVVPLGVPLIAGPGVLTALVMQVDIVRIWMTLAAFAASLVATLLIFRADRTIEHFLGMDGTRAMSKVANLLLAAYGVMMIRSGIFEIVLGAP